MVKPDIRSLVIGILATSLGLLFSVTRDFYLPDKLSDISVFVSYIGLCAMITTPFGERVQYGFAFNLKKSWLPLLLILSFFLISVDHLILISGHEVLSFVFGLTFNIFYCLLISLLLGNLSYKRGPHIIRSIGPIFPLANIALINLGIREPLLLANLSYATIFVIVIFLVFKLKSAAPKKAIKAKFLLNSIWSPFVFHYISFFFAYLLVFINLHQFHQGDFLMLKIRAPIYCYVIFSFFMPYLGGINYKNILTPRCIFILFSTLILAFKILSIDLPNSRDLAIISAESALVLFFSFVSYRLSRNLIDAKIFS
ncbi:hypothetical protein MCERHM63_00830 [Candidatus Methylopumilus planktonicus]|uniref:hypothetical protein n=1 Tax=Candidatus Methylopumilus planktonicus TaxID=1581557 RepID=UPI003BEF111D